MAKYKNPRYLLDGVEYPIDGSSPVPDTAQVLFFNEKDKADYPADKGQRKEILSEAGGAAPVRSLDDAGLSGLPTLAKRKFLTPDREMSARMHKDLQEYAAQQGKPGAYLSFKNFVGDKYAGKPTKANPLATGKEKPGSILRAARVLNEILSGTAASGADLAKDGARSTPEGRFLSSARKALFGKSEEDALLQKYTDLVTPKPKEGEGPGFWSTAGYMATNPFQVGKMAVEGLFDPEELPTNIASMVASGGIGKLAKVAQAARPATASGRLLQRGLTAGNGAFATGAADAGIGGLSGAYQSGEFNGGDFSLGAGLSMGMGAVPWAVTSGAGKAGLKKVGNALGLVKKKAPAPGPTLNESWAKASRTAALQGGPVSAEMPASFLLEHVGSNTKTPGAKRRLEEVGQQLAADPALRQRIAPDLLDDELADTDLVLAALEGAKKREAAAVPVAPEAPAPMPPAKAETLRQSLPTTPENEASWFGEGTAKQQADKIRKAAKAYRELRAAGLIDENPRYEGKTEADLLTEHLAAQKEGDSPVAQGLRDELEQMQRHDVIRSMLESAYDRQRYMNAAGELRKSFSELSPQEQRHFIDRADEMDEIGKALMEELGPAYAPLKRLSSNTSLDDAKFGNEVKAWLSADQSSRTKTEAVQRTQMDAALTQQAELDPIYDAAGVQRPALGKSEPAVAPDAEAQSSAKADEDFGVKSDDYAASDIEDRVSILEADLKSRPELAAEVGIDDALLKRSENSNSHTAGKAKKEIRAKLTQFAKDNPELPESFR